MRPCIFIGAGICVLSLFGGREAVVRGQMPDPPPPKLIVLESGQVIEGRISPNGAGFYVSSGTGKFLIPSDWVKLTAADRGDAYRKYRAMMPEPTPSNHYYLARWCLKYDLTSDARHELKQALLLDPHHAEARGLLVQLERALGEISEPKTPQGDAVADRDRDGFRAVGERSAYGLTSEAVGTYVSRIQPVLMHSCATVGCHHRNANNDLKLQYVSLSGRTNRLATEANLGAVLAMIDRTNPSRSPLLAKARDEHGGAHRSLARQRRGPEILELFDDWVHQSASDLQSTGNLPDAPSTASPILQVGATSDAGRGHRSSLFSNSSSREHVDFVSEILRETRPDLFDPAAFNRRRD